MLTVDTVDWIESGHISPQEPLSWDLGANVKECDLQCWNLRLPDFDVRIQDSEARFHPPPLGECPARRHDQIDLK